SKGLGEEAKLLDNLYKLKNHKA
ncbi:hypothetical protein LKX21_02970, partial [Campylobacter jejuni]|nr:hypothetical protein [Campylobacter jejuni]